MPFASGFMPETTPQAWHPQSDRGHKQEACGKRIILGETLQLDFIRLPACGGVRKKKRQVLALSRVRRRRRCPAWRFRLDVGVN
jgi:hypothetical protein